jgi:hypothetical protein
MGCVEERRNAKERSRFLIEIKTLRCRLEMVALRPPNFGWDRLIEF